VGSGAEEPAVTIVHLTAEPRLEMGSCCRCGIRVLENKRQLSTARRLVARQHSDQTYDRAFLVRTNTLSPKWRAIRIPGTTSDEGHLSWFNPSDDRSDAATPAEDASTADTRDDRSEWIASLRDIHFTLHEPLRAREPARWSDDEWLFI
jgi:hypothetical protein